MSDEIDSRLSRRGLLAAGLLASTARARAAEPEGANRDCLTPQDFGAIGDGNHDDTAALQSWIAACESDSYGGGREGYVPAGQYRRTRTLTFAKRYITIRGAGPWASQIVSTHARGPVFVVAAIPYWIPLIESIGILGDPLSGHGFDTSAVQDQVCHFAFANLYSYTGGAAIYAPRLYSGYFQNWFAESHHDHAFTVACGPAVSWISCYPGTVPSNKAGYRLCGSINMFACNGINHGGFWAIFGQAAAQTDGFERDFPFPDNYPDVMLIGCNIEGFERTGILLHQSHRQCEIIGGGIDATSTRSRIHSLIRVYYPGLSVTAYHNSIKLGLAAVAKGRYVPSGAYLYSDAANFFEDRSGAFGYAGIQSYYSAPHQTHIPLIQSGSTNDLYGDTATYMSALETRRLSLQVIRYTTKKLEPVGANQSIDVTGHTKVIVAPPAPASISRATFDETPSAGADYLRNGDLLIEAGNDNLSINHTDQASQNTFRLTARTNLSLFAGQICRFCRSDTTGQWIQI